MEKSQIAGKIAEILDKSEKRKFVQSVEVCLNFDGINIESSEHKLNLNVLLPKGRGKDVEIGVFADGDMNVNAKKLSKHVLDSKSLEEYAKNKRKMRNFARGCYGFIAQADMMSKVGKNWGIVLAPRGKMPQPVPPNVDLEQTMKRVKNTVGIKSKKNPTVHVPVGVESMKAEDLAENIMAVYNAVESRIRKENIKSVYAKTTMGEAIRLW